MDLVYLLTQYSGGRGRAFSNPVVPQIVAPPNANDLRISHEILTLLGHSTNVLILALFLNENRPRERKDIIKALKEHKKAVEKDDNISFAASRILVGRTTVNYWIDELVKSGLLHRVGYDPVEFSLMTHSPLIQSFMRLQSSHSFRGMHPLFGGGL